MYAIFKKLPKVNNQQLGENSPNLVTLQSPIEDDSFRPLCRDKAVYFFLFDAQRGHTTMVRDTAE
jgi:hypothetical protein